MYGCELRSEMLDNIMNILGALSLFRWGIELWDKKPEVERNVDEGIAFADKVLILIGDEFNLILK